MIPTESILVTSSYVRTPLTLRFPVILAPVLVVSNFFELSWYNSTAPFFINFADVSLVLPATLLFTFISTLPAELPAFICKSPVSLCIILFVPLWKISISVLFHSVIFGYYLFIN